MNGTGEMMGESQALMSKPRKLSLTERLETEQARLQMRLGEIDAVLTALRENPKLQEIIDLVFRVA